MTTTPMTPGRAAATAVLAAAALATGCGSTSSAANPGTTVTVTQAPTGAPSTTAPASSAPAGPPPCPTNSLAAKPGPSQGAAGSTEQVIDFTNISGVTCTLYGYPGVALAGGNPVKQIGVAADENPATPRQLVTLAPGAVANALLRIVDAGNFPASKCGPVQATHLQIYPPNQTRPIYIPYSSLACAKPVHLLTVDVVKPGSGG